jgi:hypothetical protein
MGIIGSKNKTVVSTEDQKYLNLYKTELMGMSDIIKNIIINEQNDPKYKIPEYNLLIKNTCNNYAMVFKDNLVNLPKIHLKELASDLMLIPVNNDLVYIKGQTGVREKKELCYRISLHYIKILNLLNSIYGVLGLNDNGQNNICNIALTSLMMPSTKGVTVKYCKDKQDINVKEFVGMAEYINMLIETGKKDEEHAIKNFLMSIKSYLGYSAEEYKAVGGYYKHIKNSNNNNNNDNTLSEDEKYKIRLREEKVHLEKLKKIQAQKETIEKERRIAKLILEKEKEKKLINEVHQELVKREIAKADQKKKASAPVMDPYNRLVSLSNFEKKKIHDEIENNKSLYKYTVNEKLPIFKEEICKNKFAYEISDADWVGIFSNYKTAYELFTKNYKHNIDKLRSILDKLYVKEKEEYLLKMLTEEELDILIKEAKIIMNDFFTSCIKNYITAIYEFNLSMNKKITDEQKLEVVKSELIEKQLQLREKQKILTEQHQATMSLGHQYKSISESKIK